MLKPATLELGGGTSAPFEINLVPLQEKLQSIPALPELSAPPVLDEPLDLLEPAPTLPPPPPAPKALVRIPPPPPENPRRASPESREKLPVPPASAGGMPSVESETLPQQVYNPPHEYPLAARRHRLEGSVIVEVEVLDDGSTAGVGRRAVRIG